jgi:hypothetical protein
MLCDSFSVGWVLVLLFLFLFGFYCLVVYQNSFNITLPLSYSWEKLFVCFTLIDLLIFVRALKTFLVWVVCYGIVFLKIFCLRFYSFIFCLELFGIDFYTCWSIEFFNISRPNFKINLLLNFVYNFTTQFIRQNI